MIQNPILRGFNPDPSIIRVNEDYFIAVSTFEWFPGVQIHHSKNLANWELVSHVLTRESQLDMIGIPDSCGVWAPCLSYNQGTFYLVYSNVKSFDGPWKDTPNFLVTTKNINEKWSEPISLSSSGFDGSLFHDEDGKKWYTSMIVDHRFGKFFGGILLQEYDHAQKKMVGKRIKITDGTALGITEAPHIYKKDGLYYLILAEGGTEYGHAVTILRSPEITGPYEAHPENPWITARDYPFHPLQKCGHADLVQSSNGEWYVVFLTGRPLTTHGRCITGRETAIEKIIWKDGWPYLETLDKTPRISVPSPFEHQPIQRELKEYSFDNDILSLDFQSLRVPISEDWCTLKARQGYLRLYGQESLSSFHNQSLIARRITEHQTRTSVVVDFQPLNFQHMAGLVMYYNTYHWHYIYLSADDEANKVLQILTCDKHGISEMFKSPIPISDSSETRMRIEWNRDKIQCYFAEDELDWQMIGEPVDGSILSDDYVRDENVRYRPAFTGAFVGMCCQDLTGNRNFAEFKSFVYEEISIPQ